MALVGPPLYVKSEDLERLAGEMIRGELKLRDRRGLLVGPPPDRSSDEVKEIAAQVLAALSGHFVMIRDEF